MAIEPICEPIALARGRPVRSHRMFLHLDTPRRLPTPHFHDLSEIVFFERVNGAFAAGGRRYPLTDGSVVFVPSMCDHDFSLGQGENVWRLVQIDPAVVAQFSIQPDISTLNDAVCAQLDVDACRRLLMLIDWLEAIEKQSGAIALSARVLGLMLALIAGETRIRPTEHDMDGSLFHRVSPALEQLQRQPSNPPMLGTAAALCNMSSDYFGRTFKHLFGSSFAAYSLSFRLKRAAQDLLTTRQSVSEIAYAFGFPNVSHFSFRFRQHFGMTPRQYRNEGHRHLTLQDAVADL